MHTLRISGLSFDAAHITLVDGKNYGLHGHTFNVSLTLKGEVRDDSYTVVDVLYLRELLSKKIEKMDHALIIGEGQVDLAESFDPGNYRISVIPYPQASMEALAEYIALDLWREIKSLENIYSLTVCVSQGLYEESCFKVPDNAIIE